MAVFVQRERLDEQVEQNFLQFADVRMYDPYTGEFSAPPPIHEVALTPESLVSAYERFGQEPKASARAGEAGARTGGLSYELAVEMVIEADSKGNGTVDFEDFTEAIRSVHTSEYASSRERYVQRKNNPHQGQPSS